MKRIAFYGGSFDPVHNGHLAVARSLVPLLALDSFYFMPAFHAPHKAHCRPASVFHRYSMLAVCTKDDENIYVTDREAMTGDKRFSADTIADLKRSYPDDRIFFVMGADSWMDITTWRRWEEVLTAVDHIVVSRPGYEIDIAHVTPAIRERVVDLRRSDNASVRKAVDDNAGKDTHIFITDAVKVPVSATEIREDARDGVIDRLDDLPAEVAKYIEKYELYS